MFDALKTRLWHRMMFGVEKTEGKFVDLLCKFAGTSAAVRYLRNPSPRHSVEVLRRFGAEVGEDTKIKRTLKIDNAQRDEESSGDFRRLQVGDGCYIGDDVYLDLADRIIIEASAIVSGRASFVTHADCNRSEYLASKFPREKGPIVVGQGAWIGFGATLLAGTVIGRESMVAANSLVVGEVEPRTLYAGSPAKKIRDLEE